MRIIRISILVSLLAIPSTLSPSGIAMAMPDCDGMSSTPAMTVDSVQTTNQSVSSSYVDLVRKGQQVYNNHLKGLSKRAARREFQRLTAYQQKAVKAYHTKTGSRSTFCSAASTAQDVVGGKCTANGMALSATNALGMKLWDYTQEIYFCYDGSEVYDTSYSVNVTTYLIFWSAQPYLAKDEFPEASYYRVHTQAHMNICIVAGNIGCVADYYPWIDMWGYPDGNKNTYWSY